MHMPGQQDADLHYPTGEHRGTPPTTDGRALERYEARICAHLEAHRTIDNMPAVYWPAGGGATDGR